MPVTEYEEMLPLYEMDDGDPCGPLWGYYVKGDASDEGMAEFALDYGYDPTAFVGCAVRTYCHRGPTGEMFYHAEPGRGRFRVTVVDIWDYRSALQALGVTEEEL